MTVDSTPIFESLAERDFDKALLLAAEYFHESGDFHRLFEIRKMQARRKLNLPFLVWGKLEGLEPEVREGLDRELLAACRETAERWMAQGNLVAAWPYLEPLEDRMWVQRAIESLPVHSENVETLIEYTFHRGGHPLYGYRLILQHSGTCNAITLLDSAGPYMDRELRIGLAEELVTHFFRELLGNLRSARLETSESVGPDLPDDLASFREVVECQSQLFAGGPHIDATHLHSVTRLGLPLRKGELLAILQVLSQYGAQLAPMFHFPGQPPFEEHFSDCVWFYRALNGEQIAEAIAHFDGKLVKAQGTADELVVRETLVDWFVRLGRLDRAIETALGYTGDNFGDLGIAPNLIEVVRSDEAAATRLAQHFRDAGDVLSHLLAVMATGANSAQEQP